MSWFQYKFCTSLDLIIYPFYEDVLNYWINKWKSLQWKVYLVYLLHLEIVILLNYYRLHSVILDISNSIIRTNKLFLSNLKNNNIILKHTLKMPIKKEKLLLESLFVLIKEINMLIYIAFQQVNKIASKMFIILVFVTLTNEWYLFFSNRE